MGNERLRVYLGSGNAQTAKKPPETVTVSLGEVFPLLADAVANQRAWLRDFEDDKIAIPMDLYELVLAYQHFHRPSA